MAKPDKYVVILELENGYIDCIAICDTAAEAYGRAYLELLPDDEELAGDYFITTPQPREGENGVIIHCVNKETGKIENFCTVLFYRGEVNDG